MKKGRDSSIGRVSVKKGRDSSAGVALTGNFFPRVRFRNTPLQCCYRPGVLSHVQTSIVSSTHTNTAHTSRSGWRLQDKATRISCKR